MGTQRVSRHGPRRFMLLAACLSAASLTNPCRALAQSNELAAFGARMIGTWEGDDSRHEFAWGVDERVVKSASYFPDGNDWTLVSEGWWYWDPAIGAVRGQTVAIGMGIDLFEYTSRLSENQIVHELRTHGEMAGAFVERWTFEADRYTWELEQDGERLMGGTYQRVR